MRTKVRLVEFDRLKKESQDEKTSRWKGDKGVYVFESLETMGVNKPVKKVYLNRQFMSGLFKTKKVGEYSADLKEPDRRRYLLFRLRGSAEMEVWEKVQAS
jgi:hypothetical protein